MPGFSPASFAAEVRRIALDGFEFRRALQPADRPAPTWTPGRGEPLSSNLSAAVDDFIGDGEVLDRPLPAPLASEILAAAPAAPANPPRISAFAASEARARLADGLANRLAMALRMNDLDLVNPVVTDTKVQMGLTLTPQETALAGRAALHGLVEAYRQDACRERGEAPLADITLPLPSAPASQPVPVTVAVAEPAAAPIQPA